MESVWDTDYRLNKRKALEGSVKAEAAVIGGGLAGILTAYFLRREGIQTVVLEADKIGGGQTKNTTAKITMQHGYVYNTLINKYGMETASLYADAQKDAILLYKNIIEEETADCNFEKISAALYEIEGATKLESEQKAYEKLGINYESTNSTKLPFEVSGVLKIHSQYQFHPLKFISEISKNITVYEDTMVRKIVDGNIITDRGNVKADQIIVATHYPFINYPGCYFVKNHQERSYAAAVKNAKPVDAMYRDVNSSGFSFRNYKDLLIIGGKGHRTGKGNNMEPYKSIIRASEKWYPNSRIICRWSAQDCITPDKIPYIGAYSSKLSQIYLLTGFQKWGMTNSMIGARLIADMAANRSNKYLELFYPKRFSVKAMFPEIILDGAESVKGLTKTALHIPLKGIKSIKIGEGKIVMYKGKKIGVYREEGGKIYKVSVKCSHLGCELKWNKEEKTWDCPCHGSRFDYKGKIIDNPAMKEIGL